MSQGRPGASVRVATPAPEFRDWAARLHQAADRLQQRMTRLRRKHSLR